MQHLGYEVWAECNNDSTSLYYYHTASFMYFQEALDYRDYAEHRDVGAVIRNRDNGYVSINKLTAQALLAVGAQ